MRPNSRIIVSLAAAATLFATQAVSQSPSRKPQTSEDATSLQMNAAHNGNIDFAAGFQAPLHQLWKRKFNGFASYAAIANQVAYVVVQTAGNERLNLYALRLADGSTLWKQQLQGNFWATPAYEAGKVFVSNRDGQLTAFDAGTGAQLWVRKLHTSSNSPPTPFDGHLYVKGFDSYFENAGVYSIDEATGKVKWKFPGLEASHDAPAVGDGGVFTCDAYRLSPQTGEPVWHYANGCADPGATAVFSGMQLYVRGMGQNTVLGANSGNPTGTFGGSMPAFFELAGRGASGVTVAEEGLYCFSRKTGEVAWSFAGDGQLSGPPIVVNGNVIIGSWLGDLYMLSGVDGTVLWSTTLENPIRALDERNQEWPSSALAAGDGVLIVPASNTVVAFAAK